MIIITMTFGTFILYQHKFFSFTSLSVHPMWMKRVQRSCFKWANHVIANLDIPRTALSVLTTLVTEKLWLVKEAYILVRYTRLGLVLMQIFVALLCICVVCVDFVYFLPERNSAKTSQTQLLPRHLHSYYR